jgi:hypothetical protein
MLQLALDQASAAIVPLTQQEKIRLRSLVQTIQRGMSTFLEVGACLLELRGSRLYRETHSTFESFLPEYVRARPVHMRWHDSLGECGSIA